MEDGVAYIHLQMVVSSQVSQDILMTTPTKHVEPTPQREWQSRALQGIRFTGQF